MKKVIEEFLDKRRQNSKKVLRSLTLYKKSLKVKNSMRVSPNIKLVPAKERARLSFTEGLSDLSNLSIMAPVPISEPKEERRGEISYFSSEVQDPGEVLNTDNLEESELITLPELAISHFGLIEAMLKKEEEIDFGESEGSLNRKISRMESALYRVISTRPNSISPFNFD